MSLIEGKKFDRVSMTWMDVDAYDAMTADREERAFRRQACQGQLAAPMLISDAQPHLMSMTNGKHYDSKSEMRKEYKRAGAVEVGNDVQWKRTEKTRDEKRRAKEARRGACARALSKMGFGAP